MSSSLLGLLLRLLRLLLSSSFFTKEAVVFFADFLSLLEKSIRRFIFIFLVKKDVLNALYKAHRNTQRRRRIRKQRAPLLARELYIFLIYNIKKEAEDKEEMETTAADLTKTLPHRLTSPYSKCFNRVPIVSVHEKADENGGLSLVGETLVVGGWVKTGREADAGKILFLEVNDGSTPQSLQVVVSSEIFSSSETSSGVSSLADMRPTGTSVVIEGEIKLPPETAKGQVIELHASRVLSVGKCDASTYPIAKKKQTLEYLRDKIHMRPRTNTIQSIARVRNALAFATHEFFNLHGFCYVHTPLITKSDCEGAGEMFQVTTLLGECDEEDGKKFTKSSVEEAVVMEKRAETAAIETKIAEMKQEEKPSKSGLKEQNKKLEQAKKDLSELERKFRKVGGLQRSEDGTIDYSEDFFGEKTFLTVSGQLAVETYACALSNVYTFGPTFRAEDSYTTRHLAEFWMIEPELAFADLNDDMQCAEDYVRHCCKYLLKTCRKDLEFFQKMYDKNCLERVENVANNPFGRVSYTEAIEILKDAVETKKKEFVYPVEWGIDLATEHERYLAEEVYKKPVVVYNYPKDIKAFYMRLNPDGKTVAAMDILVPKVGELVGGSQREERLDVLEQRMKDCGLELEEYSWYLDLRRYGSVTHSGFGLGFERLILFTTGMENIRDVIPYPRWPKNCLEGH